MGVEPGRRMGVKPGRTIGRADYGHRPAMHGVAGVNSLGNMSGGVRDVGAVHQHSPVHVLRTHLRTQPRQPLLTHAAQVDHSRTLPNLHLRSIPQLLALSRR